MYGDYLIAENGEAVYIYSQDYDFPKSECDSSC